MRREVSITVNTGEPEGRTPNAIFNQGQAFFLAGNRCLLPIEVGPGKTQYLPSAGVVNLCLAAELFMKSILVTRDLEAPKKHELKLLFGLIPAEDQAQLRAAYGAFVTEPDLDTIVNEVSEYFVKVRYGYEFEIFAYQEEPVFQLARTLYKYCAHLNGVEGSIEGLNL